MGTPLRFLTLQQLQQSGVDAVEAAEIAASLGRALAGAAAAGETAPQEVWRRVSKAVLQPDHPLPLHRLLYQAAYAGWDAAVSGPPPAWVPTPDSMAATNAAAFMRSWRGTEAWRQLRSGDPGADWDLLQRLSWAAPEAFWPHLLARLRVRFHRLPHRVLEAGPDPDSCRWLPGARLNIAESALAGPDLNAPAIVWADEAAPRQLRSVSLGQLALQSAHVADALRAAGFKPGDAVALSMPMTAPAVAAYLGILLAGCTAALIADSFAAPEIAARLRIAGARAIITQDVVLRDGHAHPLYVRVAEAAAPLAIVLPASGGQLQAELRPGDLSWQAFLAAAPQPAAVHPHLAGADDTASILFSSGTSGDPKAIPWSHVTPLRCAANAHFHQDVRRGDVVCWPTNMGWMLGPWLVFGALLNGATIALLHGSPRGRPFGEFVQAAGVTMLGVVPSLVKAWRASGCMAGLDWGAIRCFSSAGEASAPDDVLWLMARAGYKPVMDSCGGTEIAGSFLTGSPLQPQAPSTFSTPTVGHRPAILVTQPDGTQALSLHGDAAAVAGELAILVPALGTSQRLLNGDHAGTYFEGLSALDPALLAGSLQGTSSSGSSSSGSSGGEGASCRWFLRRHGDAFERLPGGSYRARGRLDDTMNLGGIKVGSVELEHACVEGMEGVVEAAAVACPPPDGGPDQLHLFLVMQPGLAAAPAELQQRCQAAISSRLNPLFKVHSVQAMAELPRNPSGKLLRRELRAAVAQRGASKL